MRSFAIFSLSVIITVAVSFAGIAQYNSSNDIDNFDVRIRSLLSMHQEYLAGMLKNVPGNVDSFDRTFFSDVNFIQNRKTERFFNTVKSSIENGTVANFGLVRISYMKMTSINGKVVGVNYRYICDGKNIVLIRGSYNDGQLLKAVYQYNLNGKLLEAKEFKGNRIISQKSHELTI